MQKTSIRKEAAAPDADTGCLPLQDLPAGEFAAELQSLLKQRAAEAGKTRTAFAEHVRNCAAQSGSRLAASLVSNLTADCRNARTLAGKLFRWCQINKANGLSMDFNNQISGLFDVLIASGAQRDLPQKLADFPLYSRHLSLDRDGVCTALRHAGLLPDSPWFGLVNRHNLPAVAEMDTLCCLLRLQNLKAGADPADVRRSAALVLARMYELLSEPGNRHYVWYKMGQILAGHPAPPGTADNLVLEGHFPADCFADARAVKAEEFKRLENELLAAFAAD